MKKIFFLFLISLPFVGFCDSLIDGAVPTGVYLFRYTSFDKTPNRLYVPYTVVKSEDELFSVFSSATFCFKVILKHSSSSGDTFTIRVPSLPSFGTPLSISVTNSVTCVTNGVTFSCSPLYFTSVSSLYRSAAMVFSLGYRGPGVQFFESGTSNFCVNVNYPLLVSDVLSSTNTVFRHTLLSSLSSIDSNVQSICLDLGGLQSSVDHGNNILSNIDRSVSSVLPSLYNTTNILSSIDLSSSVIVSNTFDLVSNTSSILSGVDLLHDDWTVSNIDVFLGDDTQAWIDFLYLAVSDGLISRSDADSYSSVLRSTDPSRSKSYSIPDSRRRFYVKRQIKNTVVEAQKLRGKYQSFRNALSSNNEFTSDIALVFRDFGNMSGISELVNYGDLTRSWQDRLRQDLQDWKDSDERGILNVRDDIRSNFSYRYPRSGTNELPFTSFVTNFVTRVITNVIRQSSNDISSNVVDQAERTRKLFDDKLFDPNSDGVNVRIKWPLRYESTYEVNVHDKALDDILGNLHDYSTTMSNLIEGALFDFKNNLTSTNSIDWAPWFEKWGEYADIVTNFYVQFNGSGPVADLANRFLSEGFDSQAYVELPWFSRVEVLLAMIAGVSTNSVDVADISEELDVLVDDFSDLGTNVVVSSESFVGLFGYVRRTADRFKSVFGDRSAPVTDGGIVLLSAGSWIGNEPLVLKVNSTVQNVLRLFFRCFWLLSALVVVWLVVSWSWQKVVAILRWLWSMFEL